MANISRIDVRIATGNRSGAGTNGHIFIGACGREFVIDSSDDDFERGADRTYTLGAGGNVSHKEFNDPRNPQLNTGHLTRFPVYLRFEPAGDHADWNLEQVDITVNPGENQVKYTTLASGPNLWLGQNYGKMIYLKGT
ncbi:MAG: hypothetical protein HXS41_11765 [Theionarchaea archaeon]|nr:hypothetical protein [Theionarchaea archaeon]MBU7001936.1 hypothetical protein [Theionarchaea archaeon]MBU7021726.1 hypothetical protein [Theionarchaea archaeon]MBU7035753.1 hypothetical protein [Theionarchaea archaeon]MBU7041463.1 hypothetical protein [Theionarchaea archaeon]